MKKSDSFPLAVILGTRPEIIKMAPIIRYCAGRNVKHVVIHTGQHYSFEMDRIFFRDLELKDPDHNLEVGSGTHGAQTGRLLTRLEDVLTKIRPSAVLVEGDTNSVLAGALVAVKMQIPVGHVEAGLRSYDRSMPEEINRILVDHISRWLFAPTGNAKDILIGEGIQAESIFVSGNTIVDAVNQNLPLAEKQIGILDRLDVRAGRYLILTLHRQENVDDPKRLKSIFEGLYRVSQETGMEILYPVHPRTRKRIEEYGFGLPKSVRSLDPIGYLEFLCLMSHARMMLTDSGGIQEEACILHIPCVTLRENTERPETLDVGSNMLGGVFPESISAAAQKMLVSGNQWKNPFGDGKSGKNIVETILKSMG